MKYITSPKRRALALTLRQEGKSYNEIHQQLGVAKSTLSVWLKDVDFSESIKQDNILRVKQIWAANIRIYNKQRHQKYLKDRETLIKEYASHIKKLNPQDLFFLGMGLFWGEGSKTEKFCIRFSNADPQLILASLKFMTENCGIAKDQLRGRVHIHPNVTTKEAIDYWSYITGINSNRIGVQTKISKASRGLRFSRQLPYGTFHLYISNSAGRAKVEGWFRGIREQFILPE